jgi:hypothetical protein
MWYAWGNDTMKSRGFCTSLTTRTPILRQSAVPSQRRANLGGAHDAACCTARVGAAAAGRARHTTANGLA